MEVILLSVVTALVVGFILLSRMMRSSRKPLALPGVAWTDPVRQSVLHPLLFTYGYEVTSSAAQHCVLEKQAPEGKTERCILSFQRPSAEHHRFLLGQDGDSLRGEGEEVVRFDFEFPCAQAWPDMLRFALASSEEDARRYLEDEGVQLQQVHCLSRAACRVLPLEEEEDDVLQWSGQTLMDLFVGEDELALKRLRFYGDWLVLSALRRDEERLHLRFYLSTVDTEVWPIEKFLANLFDLCEKLREHLDGLSFRGILDRASEILEDAIEDRSFLERLLAVMTSQAIGLVHPGMRTSEDLARIVEALNATPHHFEQPALIASLDAAQCRALSLHALLKLFSVHQASTLSHEIRDRMSLDEMLGEASLPASFVKQEVRESWQHLSPEAFCARAPQVHAAHAMGVLSFLFEEREDLLGHPGVQEAFVKMVTLHGPERQEELFTVLQMEQTRHITALDEHLLLLLDEGKWQHGELIVYILLANDLLPPLYIETWQRIVSDVEVETMREMLLGLDLFEEQVLLLWAAFGEHVPHYEALEQDGQFREQVVQRTMEVCERPGEITASMSRALARHARAWFRYEEKVFGETARYNLLMKSVGALLARLDEAPFHQESIKHLSALTSDLPPSMTSMISKAIKRWERRHAQWSQGALTFVESTEAGGLTLSEGEASSHE